MATTEETPTELVGTPEFEIDESSITKGVTKKLMDMMADRGEVGLTPQDVLSEAKDPASPLHRHFEWDDSKAAEKFRLQQARMLIMHATVSVAAGGRTVRMRAFVSIDEDRKLGGGYRALGDVMSDEEQRQKLLRTARKEAESFKNKYQHLSELSAVFDAIDKL